MSYEMQEKISTVLVIVFIVIAMVFLAAGTVLMVAVAWQAVKAVL